MEGTKKNGNLLRNKYNIMFHMSCILWHIAVLIAKMKQTSRYINFRYLKTQLNLIIYSRLFAWKTLVVKGDNFSQ